jgi:hypothetical protein
MEYRFRGYDVMGRKGWVYGDLTHNKKVLKVKPYLIDRVMVGGYEVYPESVGMATGLLDESGSEIFVGDIVRIYDNRVDRFSESEVVFSRGIIGVLTCGQVTPLGFFYNIRDGVLVDNGDYTIYINGNVFENSFNNK